MDLTELQLELQDAKYAAMTDAEVVVELNKGTPTVGRIEGDNKLNLLAWEAGEDLEYEALEFANDTQNDAALRKLARALAKNLNPQLIMLEKWRINLADPKVQGLFQACVAAGLLTATQKTELEEMATFEKPSKWHGATEKQVYIARNNLIGIGTISYNYDPNPVVEDRLTYLVNSASTSLSIIVYLDAPAPHNINGALRFETASENQTDDASYAPFPAAFSFRIEKGQSSVPIKMSGSNFSRYLRTKVELDMNVTATVQVRGV